MKSEIASGIWKAVAVLLVAGAVGASAANAAEGVLADLPFVTQDGHYEVGLSHIVVDLGVPGGRPMPLLLDTGASWSVMTPAAAKQLGVSVRRHKSKPYRRGTSLGRDLQFWVDVSSSDTGSRSGWELGVLGGNFLENYSVEIDYVAQRVRFLDPKSHPVASEPTQPGEIIVPLRLQGRRPFAELALANGKASFLVNTGASFDLEISERRASELGHSADGGEIVEGRNWIGRDRSRQTELESVRIAGAEVGPSELLTTLRGESAWRHTNQIGSDEAALGARFLSRFHVRIDYKHRRMSLVPLTAEEREQVLAHRSPPTDAPGKPVSGSSIRLEGGGLLVSELEPGVFRVEETDSSGPAAAFGLLPADVILHPYGATRLTVPEVERRIIDRTELTVARRDGDVWIDTVLPEPAYFEEAN